MYVTGTFAKLVAGHDTVPMGAFRLAPRSRQATVGAVALLCLAGAATAGASSPGRNGRIAFALERAVCGSEMRSDEPGCVAESIESIFTIEPDGSDRRRLSTDAEEPSFSSGGSLVAFQGPYSIFIKPWWGGAQSRLVRGHAFFDLGDIDPTWSPSSQRIAFARISNSSGHYFVHTINRDGSGVRRLRRGTEPNWSPTDRIAFARLDRILTMAPGGARLRHLGPGYSPNWSPDGRWLTFTRRLARGRYGIALMRADGSRLRTLTRGPWDAGSVWSPDMRYIAYVHRNRRKAREKIVVMNLQGRRKRTILKTRRSRLLAPGEAQVEDLSWQALPN